MLEHIPAHGLKSFTNVEAGKQVLNFKTKL